MNSGEERGLCGQDVVVARNFLQAVGAEDDNAENHEGDREDADCSKGADRVDLDGLDAVARPRQVLLVHGDRNELALAQRLQLQVDVGIVGAAEHAPGLLAEGADIADVVVDAAAESTDVGQNLNGNGDCRHVRELLLDPFRVCGGDLRQEQAAHHSTEIGLRDDERDDREEDQQTNDGRLQVLDKAEVLDPQRHVGDEAPGDAGPQPRFL